MFYSTLPVIRLSSGLFMADNRDSSTVILGLEIKYCVFALLTSSSEAMFGTIQVDIIIISTIYFSNTTHSMGEPRGYKEIYSPSKYWRSKKLNYKWLKNKIQNNRDFNNTVHKDKVVIFHQNQEQARISIVPNLIIRHSVLYCTSPPLTRVR